MRNDGWMRRGEWEWDLEGMRRIETREKEEISDKKFNKYKGFNKG